MFSIGGTISYVLWLLYGGSATTSSTSPSPSTSTAPASDPEPAAIAAATEPATESVPDVAATTSNAAAGSAATAATTYTSARGTVESVANGRIVAALFGTGETRDAEVAQAEVARNMARSARAARRFELILQDLGRADTAAAAQVTPLLTALADNADLDRSAAQGQDASIEWHHLEKDRGYSLARQMYRENSG
ncbi:hypothetical protein [Mangrovibrevibacter kandeliae]|uniref:hypothetical protein n=1 Tax=Mangrovibrevibacter kandeliae TaxID=2968473 RepID=UPI0021186956|nr:hypothetical protein [Aurantimonas sp. CSK15Z-1]MCQ8781517.1 hypothetical protein [Aurantimonas sp. CSK15Z-1]